MNAIDVHGMECTVCGVPAETWLQDKGLMVHGAYACDLYTGRAVPVAPREKV